VTGEAPGDPRCMQVHRCPTVLKFLPIGAAKFHHREE